MLRADFSCRFAKTWVVRPVSAQVVGELWAADPSRCPRGHEAHASSEVHSEAARRSWEPGHQQHQGARARKPGHMECKSWKPVLSPRLLLPNFVSFC